MCGRLEEELRRVREEGEADLMRAREEVASLTDEVRGSGGEGKFYTGLEALNQTPQPAN